MSSSTETTRKYTKCWTVTATLLLVISACLLLTEGSEGPWLLPLFIAIPMLSGIVQNLSRAAVRLISSFIVFGFLVNGSWLGYSTTQTFPYIATYDFLTVWILAIVLCGIGGAASFAKSTRATGKVFLASGIAFLIMFYLVVGVSRPLGFNRWDELNHMVPIR